MPREWVEAASVVVAIAVCYMFIIPSEIGKMLRSCFAASFAPRADACKPAFCGTNLQPIG